jgi:hypothetical protein
VVGAVVAAALVVVGAPPAAEAQGPGPHAGGDPVTVTAADGPVLAFGDAGPEDPAGGPAPATPVVDLVAAPGGG